MNTTNIKNFAKYDLTINKVFYRNMIIMAICIAIGICAFGFMGRYMIYNSANAMQGFGHTVSPDEYSHYGNDQVTLVFMSLIITMLPCIFAGCTFHNLRKKQGRIMELTLPTSNKEKYIWHIIVSVGFGFLLTLASVLVADLMNFLLHICVFGTDYTYSITAQLFDILTINVPDLPAAEVADEFSEGYLAGANAPEMEAAKVAAIMPVTSLISSFRYLAFTSSIMGICAYIYGNSVKYHYNIIITYAILVGFSILLAIGFSTIFGLTHIGPDTDMQNAQKISMINDLVICLYCLSAIFATIAGICVWRSYKRYCNAQITTATNK